MRPPMTLRHVRRVVGRGGWVVYVGTGQKSSGPDVLQAAYSQVFSPSRGRAGFPCGGVPRSVLAVPAASWEAAGGPKGIYSQRVSPEVLDRLISILGADYHWDSQPPSRPLGESRPKETNEVHPSSDGGRSDATTHGGDGNSGECDYTAQTSAAEPRTGGRHAEPGLGEPGQQSLAASSEPDPPARSDASDGGALEGDEGVAKAAQKSGADDADRDPGRAESSAQMRTGDPGPEGPTLVESAKGDDDDAPEHVARGGAGSSSDTAPAQPIHSDAGGGPVTPDTPVRRFGGWTDDEVARLRSRALSRPAREIGRALVRLIRAFDVGGTDESPRLAGSRLVRELVSRRCALSRARRRELTRQVVVLACDVSGSCSAVRDDTLAACLAVVESHDDVVVVKHSNGLLWDCDHGDLAQWLDQLETPVGAVIAFGDWDAGHWYQRVVESGTPLVWLDSFRCRLTGVAPACEALRKPAQHWKRQPLAWFQGVGCAVSAAIALRQAARLVKGK